MASAKYGFYGNPLYHFWPSSMLLRTETCMPVVQVTGCSLVDLGAASSHICKTSNYLFAKAYTCTSKQNIDLLLQGSHIFAQTTVLLASQAMALLMNFVHHKCRVKRAKRSVSALWKARSSLNHQSKRMLYFSLIQSTFLYASNAFFPCLSVGTFDLLVKVTKNAARAAFGLPSWTSSSPAFLALDLPPLLQVCRQNFVQFVFRVLHGRTSSLLQHHFSCTVTAHNQERNTIVVPFWPGPAGRSTIQFRGALLWNSLPPTVREITEYAQFTAMVKAIRLE